MVCKNTCEECRIVGKCRYRVFEIINDLELMQQFLKRKSRNCGYNKKVKASRWRDYLVDLNRDSSFHFQNSCGQIIDLDMTIFEASEDDIFSGEAERFEERQRHFFQRMFCTPVDDNALLRLRKENKEWFRIATTLLWSSFPDDFTGIIRQKPANDNCDCIACLAVNDNF